MSYCIYKIVCEDVPDFIYVGSTKAFRERKRNHKSQSYNENSRSYNYSLYKTIRDNGGWEKWRMVCIEECDDTIDSRRKAESKEEEWRQKLNANLNMKNCFTTHEQRLQQYKRYDDKRREPIKCDCGGKYALNHKTQHERTNKHQNYICRCIK